MMAAALTACVAWGLLVVVVRSSTPLDEPEF